MTLLEKWHAYVAGDDTIEDDEFSYLINGAGEEEISLNEAFGDLPNGQELIDRIEQVRKETVFTGVYHIPNPSMYRPIDELIELSETWSSQVVDCLIDLGRPEVLKRKTPIQVFTDQGYSELVREKRAQFSNALDIIHNSYVDTLYATQPYLLGLDEAVLFLSKFPEVTKFVMGPMAQQKISYSTAYELWKAGGRLHFGTSENYLVLHADYPLDVNAANGVSA